MSTDRDTTRVVRSWLEEGVTALPDRVLDAVLDQVPATPQRRSSWPAWRSARMNRMTQAALAAAAVLVVAVVGYNLLPRNGGIGTQPTPSAPPTPVVTPTPVPVQFPPSGPLAAGRHTIAREGVQLSITLPTADWRSDGAIAIDRGTQGEPTAYGLLFWSQAPVGVFADPCRNTRAPSIGPDRAALAEAITTIPGVDVVQAPTEVMVGGRPATSVAITVREDIACEPGVFYLWYSGNHARYASERGFTVWTWIVDVDGTLIWIDGETYKDAPSSAQLGIQGVIDSISFE